ncbi:hypothetical protein EVB87_026 [Rhizobium phage RHph_N28_1]|nr:hypothetical protein EVB87_026 [Rhizobium phage RHph_N28_1]QIG74054.1 hypothetical protein EVC07_026 [Rhizobium phage RHph_N42]
MALIHYSSYWGTFSRVLTDCNRGRRGWFVEVNLTPVNAWSADSWQEIKRCWIREHCTSRDKRDEATSKLERAVFDRIGEMVGKDVRHWLLTADILPMIDWDKYGKTCNGGASLFACLKDGFELPPFIVASASRRDEVKA